MTSFRKPLKQWNRLKEFVTQIVFCLIIYTIRFLLCYNFNIATLIINNNYKHIRGKDIGVDDLFVYF